MPNKIDSNFTGLRYAQEVSLGVLNGSETWNLLEPNSYGDFGAQVTTLARTPIQPGRQRKKGVVTDLDATAGFQTDFTQDNFYDLLQGFLFADWRKTPETAATAATASSDDFTVADEAGFLSGHLVFVSGFDVSANNGLHLVNGVSANAISTPSSPGLSDDTGSATVKVVGYQFGSVLSVNQVSASETELNIASLAAASKVLTLSDIDDLPTETVTIGSIVYTFVSALSAGPTVPYEVLIGVNLAAAVTNLNAAINGAAGVGTTYSVGTEAHPDVTSVTNGTTTVTATARVIGASGNAIVLDETLTDGSWAGGAVALSGGVGVGWVELGALPGQWIFVGGDTGGSTGTRFSTAGNNGFKRIRTVTDAKLVVDKTQGTMADEAAGTLTVQVFFGDVIKNEADPDLIVRRSYQLERSLSEAGFEYVLGCVANSMSINASTADKLTVDVGFVGTDSEQFDANSRKAGTFPDGAATLAEQADAFNTSSDFGRLRLARKDALQTPLFAFLEEIALTVNNNVIPNKAISVLGAFDLTAGDFVVEGSVTAYFADVAAVAAVRENADVSMDFALVKNNKGWVFDIPLLALGDGRLNVEKDQAIQIPLTIAAAADPLFNHTLLATTYDYLPALAE